MEQKQLDEADDSFFGEEFVDDEDLLEEKTTEKKSKKKPKKKEEVKAEAKIETKKEEKVEEKTEPTIQITPAKEDWSPNDPWDDPEGESLFKEASTWKAITGIVVILLIFSVFTQGFQFSEAVPEGNSLTLSAAEAKALEYVNTNLLQPPFLAEVESSNEEQGLYKVTLSVAGRSVDSYITKDGELFFPQGFSTSETVDAQIKFEEETISAEELAAREAQATEVVEPIVEEVAEDETEATTEEPVEETTEPIVGEPVVEEPVVEPEPANVELTLAAKKWLFTPNTLSVSEGDTVSLTINPSGLDFTFAIPDLGVEKEVSGPTTVSFTANSAGSFDFACSSCESWRGMTGTLNVG